MLGRRSFSVFTGCSTREVRTYLEGLKVNLRLHVDHTLAFRAQSLSLSITELAATALFGKMQGALHSFLSRGSIVKNAVLQHFRLANPLIQPVVFSRSHSVTTARMEEHGFESTTIADVLKAKGKGADGSWLWCTTDDSVYDAVQSMTQHNVGALVVIKPGEQKSIAGIITERDYLRKIIVQGRSSKSTKVGDIMTEENNLITVTPDTKVLRAMQLMTDNRIRHIPVIEGSGMVGMVSIGDVVRAVVIEHREELNRLNAFIQGGY
ncbi:hypothetical protein I3842_13G058900 [Carya illinoinensis]|uniref:CBS domain-containing protein n=1 Tax=Carya illinoinensis TaxID=32201 RepID=A0A922DDH7_CARIL|nr:hypothetical protein I3842_13G058900 [Carya illinoinensis]